MNSLPTHLRDRRIDRFIPERREAFITAAVRSQVEFALRNVPFWCDRFKEAGIDPDQINNFQDFTRLPPLLKEELRDLSVWELIPKSSRPRLYRCCGTSGTTGLPTSNFWTRSDWRAFIETMARLFEDHKPNIDIVAFNGYHQGHAAAPAFDDAIRLLGGISIPRHYLIEDELSTLAQLRAFGCNALMLPQHSTLKKKGQTVEDLLRQEPNFFCEYGIRWWIGSRSLFTQEIRKIAHQQGVISLSNIYGSSEFGILAISCIHKRDQYHLALGSVLVEVVDREGIPVLSGQRGRIVVTHLLTSHADGGLGPHEGSQIFRFDSGDEAIFLDGTCSCGLTSPRIRDIRRRED